MMRGVVLTCASMGFGSCCATKRPEVCWLQGVSKKPFPSGATVSCVTRVEGRSPTRAHLTAGELPSLRGRPMVSDHRVDRALELLVPVADEVPHPQELTCRPQRLELFV